jgi:HK97 gp10 family phage protein
MQTTIRTDLDPKNIDKAIKELQQFKKRFLNKNQKFLERIGERGVEICKQECPVDFGDLRDSIKYEVKGEKVTISATEEYLGFVEFGFGAKGDGHPSIEVSSYSDREGWIYYDDKRGEFRFSSGQPSNPFMWRTAQALKEEIPQIAKEVFK